MKVNPTGDRMVFWVQSETNPGDKYRVDLLIHGGRGECLCKDWETRRWPAIKDGAKIGSPESRCKHVTAARDFVQETFGLTEPILNALILWLSKFEQTPPTRQSREPNPF